MTRATPPSTRLAACALVAASTLGCAAARQLGADSGDFQDYRAFRLAADEGTRLRRAQDYLEAHPGGAWAAEVRAAFDAEEQTFFEAASASRARTSKYLAYLPRGPHATAAIALLTAFDTKLEDDETMHMLAAARRTEATLAHAADQRRAVGETVLGAVSALLDADVYGAQVDDAPLPLRHVLGGEAAPTWGPPRVARERDVFFSIPTVLQRESRALTLKIAVVRDAEGRITAGRISGPDLFVMWTEADEMRALDPTSPAARAAAARHVVDVLSGAFEAVLPAGRCRVPGTGEELFVRRCDGWDVSATMGFSVGDTDVVRIAHAAPPGH